MRCIALRIRFEPDCSGRCTCSVEFRQAGDIASIRSSRKPIGCGEVNRKRSSPSIAADGFEQLHEWALCAAAAGDRGYSGGTRGDHRGSRSGRVTVTSLTPSRDERANFGDDLGNGAAALGSARARHDAKGAVHVASLHDRDERRGLLWRQRLISRMVDCEPASSSTSTMEKRRSSMSVEAAITDRGHNSVFARPNHPA